MAEKITILIADDHELVREGMRMLLGREADFELVGDAADGGTALRLAQSLMPQVVVLDLGLPVMDGLEVARTLRQSGSPSRVLALTARIDSVSVHAAVACGMEGYVPKSEDSRELISAIRALASGQRYFSPAISHFLEAGGAPIGVTLREREILVCVAEGLSSKEIATRLEISTATVQKHRENLGRKLGTRNVAEMVAYAMKHLIGQ
ncbi:response regulator transcription factor [Thiobacillus sp.]|uniref:response regulator n=1 Tax=Thiobacillus sp. TaxID=924 RepID=UPI0025CCE13B|nr:response regulator transcription factor [Thiobacillus sp.]MBT9540629.1 response regulator transcription factor [Thiobacillus sp.]